MNTSTSALHRLLNLEATPCVWVLLSDDESDLDSTPSLEGVFPSHAEAEKARALMQAAEDAAGGKLHYCLTSCLTFDTAESFTKLRAKETPAALSQEDIERIRALRDRGFAITVFTPSEIPEHLSVEDVEGLMIAAVNDRI